MNIQIKKFLVFLSTIFVCVGLFACANKIEEDVKVETKAEKKTEIKKAEVETAEVKKEESNLLIDSTSVDKTTGYLLVELGSYYDNIDGDKKNLQWQIVDKTDDFTLLVSKNVIDCKNYNEEEGATSWGSSSLRKWLNNDFVKEAFTDDELRKFGKLDVFDEEYVVTGDNVAILSYNMCKKYFGNENQDKVNEKVQAKATDFAISNGMEYDDHKELNSFKNTSFFLMDNGASSDKVMWVGMYGHVYKDGQKAKLNKGDGVRPVICVRNDIFTNGVIDSINANILGEVKTNIEVVEVGDEGEVAETELKDARTYTYTNVGKEKIRSVAAPEGEKNVISLSAWDYGRTPCEWIYVEPNKQIISNNSPNRSAKFGYKLNVSSGEKGCYLPVFTSCAASGTDYEGRTYVFEDYTKIAITDMPFKNKFEDLKYNDMSIKDILKKRYELTEVSDGVVMAGDVYVNVIYVSELDDILAKSAE